MQRSACLLTVMTLLAGACGDSKETTEETNTTPPATESNPSGILSISDPMTTPDMTTTPDTTSDPNPPTSTDTPTMGDSSTTFDPNDCGEAQIQIPIVTPNVMLVLDKSGSMVADPGGYWDHDGDDADDDGIQDADMVTPATAKQTRWQSLYAVVDFIVNTFNNSMNLGASLFPSKTAKADYSAVACPVNADVEVPIAPMNAAAILGALPAATGDEANIKGGTPATKGVKAALAELMAQQSDQPKFMILVTDGAANCQEDAPDNNTLFEVYDSNLPTTVADAFSQGIPTYVVGIDIKNTTSPMSKDGNPDNTNTYEKLNEVATAGGVPRPGDEKFYNTTNEDELKAALEAISMQILSCTIMLDPVPKYPDYVEVTVNGVPYGKDQVADCANESGWQFDPEPTAITLCGQACTDFQMTGALDAQYRCPNSG